MKKLIFFTLLIFFYKTSFAEVTDVHWEAVVGLEDEYVKDTADKKWCRQVEKDFHAHIKSVNSKRRLRH